MNLDEELILEEAFAIEAEQENEMHECETASAEKVATGRRSKRMLHTKQAVSVGDLIAEARHSADDAREAEERSRLALYTALSRSYDIALRAARSPEQLAAYLVFGTNSSESQIEEVVAVLEQARDHDIEEGELADYLSGQDEGIASLLEASRTSTHARSKAA